MKARTASRCFAEAVALHEISLPAYALGFAGGVSNLFMVCRSLRAGLVRPESSDESSG